ncbi:MAG TPA: hypothetical protein HPP57_03945 [Deltaproteobacteria bacterium]|nr:hypothetical protein [Deltaproteobacteria bacterium]
MLLAISFKLSMGAQDGCSEYERFEGIEIRRAITVNGPVADVVLFLCPPCFY